MSRRRRAEVLAQIHGELWDIQLIARYYKANAVLDQARTVVRRQRTSGEDDNGIYSRTHQRNMFSYFVRSCGSIVCSEDHAPPMFDQKLEQVIKALNKERKTWQSF